MKEFKYRKQIMRSSVVFGLVISFAVISVVVSAKATDQPDEPLQWPEVKVEHQPVTWWNWHGSAVNKKDLERLMKKYYKAGLGGVNIMATYGAKGYEDQYIDFLTPRWMEMLSYTSTLADQMNMTVDLEATTGWNMGGPWVRFEDAAKRVVHETYTLLGGQKLTEPVQYLQEPYTNLEHLPREPISANPLLHRENLYWIRYERDLPLLSLMAYSEDGEVLELTDKVNREGKLDWTAPAGKWHLYAVFLGTGGKTVERAAPGGAGWQLDYLSKDPVIRQMNQFERAFSKAGYEMDELIRAFHDDSFEQYTDWTEGFFEAFKKLQGYDLRAHLPALFGKGTEEKVSRIKSDYRETVSHLIIEEHTASWTKWAHDKGVKTINQAAYGSPAHPLDNWAASDQPENTGGGPLDESGQSNHPIAYSKLASSAAHVTGKKVISQETSTWLYGHFQNSLADIKDGEIDKIFLNGSNKIAYHSTSYSPKEAEWPGWVFYAATHFEPTNPIWRDFPKLNSYVSRVSSFLQSGSPGNDILLYYPVYNIWHDEGELAMHLPQIPDVLKETANILKRQGYTFDYISDKQIKHTTYKNGRLITEGGNGYQTIVLPSVQYLPVETLDYLTDLAEEGATIIFSGGLPGDVPGFGNLKERRRRFEKLIEGLKDFRNRDNNEGNVFISQEAGANIVPANANVSREPMVDQGLRFVRRSYGGGHHYFIKNYSSREINEYVPLATDAQSVAIFDPMEKTAGMAATRTNDQNRTEVLLQLKPEETCILRTFRGKSRGKEWQYIEESDDVWFIEDWDLSFVDGGPTLPSGFSTDEPMPWTEKGGEEAKWFAGTAQYSTTFQKPSDSGADEWILDLGALYHSARVELNGEHIATLISPPFQVNITDALQEGENELTLKVTNLAANRIRYMEQKDMEWPQFYNIGLHFNASGWSVMKSGLEGPVHLIPAEQKDISQ